MSADRTAVTRFRREADNACALDHPGIVGIYDTGEYDAGNDTRVQQSRIDHDHTPHDRTRHDRNQDAGDGADDARPVPYIVLEYVDGDTLQAVLAHEGRHPAPRALEVTVGILEALRFAHRHGMVHRGLSAATVMLDGSGVPKVMDFGAGAGGPPQIPALQCASPEQLIGAPLDGRSDVYGCGCLLWQMLTGRPLFDADSPAALATQHLSAITAGLSGAAQVPAELVDIVRKATRITPLDRYQTATEMRIAVRAAMSRQSLPAVGGSTNTDGAGGTDVLEQPRTRTSKATGGGNRPGTTAAATTPAQPPDLVAGMADSPESDSTDLPRPTRWGRWVLAAACACALFGAALVTGAVLTAAPPPPLVAVPDLSGRTPSRQPKSFANVGSPSASPAGSSRATPRKARWWTSGRPR